MIEKVRLKTQIIWYFTLILIVVKITRPLRSYRTPRHKQGSCHIVFECMIPLVKLDEFPNEKFAGFGKNFV